MNVYFFLWWLSVRQWLSTSSKHLCFSVHVHSLCLGSALHNPVYSLWSHWEKCGFLVQLCVYGIIKQLAGECWLLSDRTQMAKKHSSACRTGPFPGIHKQLRWKFITDQMLGKYNTLSPSVMFAPSLQLVRKSAWSQKSTETSQTEVCSYSEAQDWHYWFMLRWLLGGMLHSCMVERWILISSTGTCRWCAIV